MTDHADLISRLEKATGGDETLDLELMALAYRRGWAKIGVYDSGLGRYIKSRVWKDKVSGKWVTTKPFEFTSSLDRALGLVERILPGCWYLLARGKLRSAEPEYGAQLLHGETPIGEGEHEGGQAIALLLALLRALQTSAPSADTGG